MSRIINKIKQRKKIRMEGFSFRKGIILPLVLISQLFIFIYFYIKFVEAFQILYIISTILSILTSFRILLKNKNPDAKTSWILFILIFPTFGYIIYFLAGGADIHPLHKKKFNKINQVIEKDLVKQDFSNLSNKTKEISTFLQNTSNSIVYDNTSIKYYGSGEEIYEDIIQSLKNAKKSIYIEFFIIHRGVLFDVIYEILKEKSKNGVDVKIIYDGFGSKELMTRKLKRKMKEDNIKYYSFSPIIPIFSFFMNYRDHRKMLIVDEKLAFVGGMNLADEYINYKKRFGHWKDSGLKLEGPAVNEIYKTFLTMLAFISKENVEIPKNLLTYNLSNNKNITIPYSTGPNQDLSVARSVYINMIQEAEKSIYIMTPYLIIDDAFINVLKNKVLSGVEVNIIIPGRPDKKIVYKMTKLIAEELYQSGINIYIYEKGFIHSKVLLTDNLRAVVGSINMDFRSFYQLYENAVYLENEEAIKQIDNDFIKTIKESIIFEDKDITKWKKSKYLLSSFLKWVAPLM